MPLELSVSKKKKITYVTRLFTCAKRGFYGGLTQKWT